MMGEIIDQGQASELAQHLLPPPDPLEAGQGPGQNPAVPAAAQESRRRRRRVQGIIHPGPGQGQAGEKARRAGEFKLRAG